MLALLAVTVPAHAQSGGDKASGTMFYASCMAAADIMEGRPPPSDPEVAARQLNKATMCLGAVTAIANIEAFLRPEFAMCPPKGGISYAQMILVIAAYLRNHPERLHENFHGLAVFALATAWPCSK
jgi:Ssp1 endopeptidase immunity protein Rap1a